MLVIRGRAGRLEALVLSSMLSSRTDLRAAAAAGALVQEEDDGDGLRVSWT